MLYFDSLSGALSCFPLGPSFLPYYPLLYPKDTLFIYYYTILDPFKDWTIHILDLSYSEDLLDYFFSDPSP
jgi:hypothetical protein